MGKAKPRFLNSPPYEGGVDAATPLLPEEGWPKAGVEGADGVVLSHAEQESNQIAPNASENHPVSSSKQELTPLLRKEGSKISRKPAEPLFHSPFSILDSSTRPGDILEYKE